MASDVFISYSTRNKLAAEAICDRLEKDAIRCWIAPRNIVPGKAWPASIIEALNECRLMVLVFSDPANRSGHVIREVERAVHKGLTIIPFRIDESEPAAELEYLIAGAHWLDAMTPPLRDHIEKLASVVSACLEAESGNAVAAESDAAGDERFIREFEQVAPDDWSRRKSSWLGRFIGSIIDDR